MVIAAMKLKDAYSLEGKLWRTWQHIKKQRHYFANKVLSSQGYGFSSSHVWMWDYKWTIKKAEWQRTDAFGIQRLMGFDSTTNKEKAESEEELKSLLMKVKEDSEKVGLKFNI